MASSDIPAEAEARLSDSAFTSGLTVPDFAACLQMGLEPVGLVQGFCVMQWGWYGAGSPFMRGMSPYNVGAAAPGAYSENWTCPHGLVSAEHRAWGQNYEQSWVEAAWGQGFGSAYSRMLEEATAAGAHGVIGLVDTVRPLVDMNVIEFHILGTAVVVADDPAPATGQPWTTYLAGQRLAKLIEAGLMPVSIAAAMSSVRVWAYCQTEYLMEGQTYAWGAAAGTHEIEQVARAHMAARGLAREQIRSQLGADSLHGAHVSSSERDLGSGDQVIECTVRGTRVRRFKEFDPLPMPRPTVRLG